MDLPNVEISPETSSQEESSQTQTNSSAELPSVYELEKLGKFKLEGREMTYQELKNAMLRQQDYTRKTQELAKERETLENNKKFHVNLAADLRLVEKDPSLASQFISVYPQEFHQYLRNVLSGTQTANQASHQAQGQQEQQRPYQDIEMMSKVDRLEKFYNQQEVAKNEAEINSNLERLATKYPQGAKAKEMVIGRVFEAYNQMLEKDPNAKLSTEMWEDAYKQVDKFVNDLVSSTYKEKQKQQLSANQKAKGADSGGGTVGRAPTKFKNLKDVTDFAVRDLTGRS